MSKGFWTTIGTLAALTLLFSACYVALHPALWYEGGSIVDNGVVSFPRFIARFNSIEFSSPGTYSFEFRHFPADTATVLLETPSAPQAATIEPLTTRITMEVTDQRGSIRCSATGFPAGLYTHGEQAFIQATPRHAVGIWLMGCNQFNVEKCDPCRLTVRISDVDPAGLPLVLVPSLSGGGIELP